MIKIAHVHEIEMLRGKIPDEAVESARVIAEILDSEYGADRNIESDFGGYLVILKEESDLEKLKEIYIFVNEIVPEYCDLIICENDNNYTNSLIIMNSDYSVTLIMPYDMTPSTLTKYIEIGE